MSKHKQKSHVSEHSEATLNPIQLCWGPDTLCKCTPFEGSGERYWILLSCHPLIGYSYYGQVIWNHEVTVCFQRLQHVPCSGLGLSPWSTIWTMVHCMEWPAALVFSEVCCFLQIENHSVPYSILFPVALTSLTSVNKHFHCQAVPSFLCL